ncbi:MAG TPA: secretin N-terminal domain-containing protein, partial [Rhodocyclaceae bacterium]|nr:secretin N-terminal domain-containing protein [Rhodocyclaceae bacterium]
PAPAAPTSAPAASLSGNPVATIQADTASNALIITAPEPVFNNLRGIIDQLDRRRAQVYVEALIAEVTAERAAEFGIQWNALSGGAVNSSRASVIGGTNFGTGGQNLLNAMTNPTGVGHGLNIMVSKGTLDVLGVKILNLSMLARFLENDTRTNILSTPNLVTLDNEEAKIVIGQNLPFVTGQYTNTGGGTTPANPFQTIERKDVGLTLKIRPQISEGGTIKLTIAQETSSVVQTTAANATGPVTNKRSLDSTVLADDGAIIALGGLVQDAFEGGDEKVPLLGDIPVVGGLFSYNSRKRSKTNLVIFLRPVILRDRDASRNLSADRYDYLIGEQKKQNADARLLRNEPEAPVLLSIDQALGGQGLLPRETPALPTGGQ